MDSDDGLYDSEFMDDSLLLAYVIHLSAVINSISHSNILRLIIS